MQNILSVSVNEWDTQKQKETINNSVRVESDITEESASKDLKDTVVHIENELNVSSGLIKCPIFLLLFTTNKEYRKMQSEIMSEGDVNFKVKIVDNDYYINSINEYFLVTVENQKVYKAYGLKTVIQDANLNVRFNSLTEVKMNVREFNEYDKVINIKMSSGFLSVMKDKGYKLDTFKSIIEKPQEQIISIKVKNENVLRFLIRENNTIQLGIPLVGEMNENDLKNIRTIIIQKATNLFKCNVKCIANRNNYESNLDNDS